MTRSVDINAIVLPVPQAWHPQSAARRRFSRHLVGALLALNVQLVQATPEPVRHWPEMARADLAAIHQAIAEGHPGVIDEQNPGFKDWMERGYQAALEMTPRVSSYDDFMSVVRWYVSGFQDGHLNIVNDLAATPSYTTRGWRAEREAGGYRVRAVAPDWPAFLPPLGAEWLGCDSRTSDQILDADVAPYWDRRPFPALRLVTARLFAHPAQQDLTQQQCSFRMADGSVRLYAQHYEDRGAPIFNDLVWPVPVAQPQGGNRLERLGAGTLWIRLGRFDLRPEDVAELNTLLEQLPKQSEVKRIVFDVRGNGGGNSGVGYRVLEAATGGLDFDSQGLDQLPQTQALWRVSPAAQRAWIWRVQRAVDNDGPDSEAAKQARDWQAQLDVALRQGQTWWTQPGTYPRLDPAEMKRRHAHLRRFKGPVALLTHKGCASACLDFADLVLSVPGAIHLGEATSGDTVYIDVGYEPLPSGNRLMLPLKVWRNRLRGNNQTWVPQYPVDLGQMDDAQVQSWALRVLDEKPLPTLSRPSPSEP